MTEFCGLRAKLYSLKIQGQNEVKKAKGVQSSVVEKTITFEDYITCLKNNSLLVREQRGIRSVRHSVRTEKFKKISLSANDDKRHIVPDRTNTLPHGHFSIMDNKMIRAVMEVEMQEAEKENENEEREEMEVEDQERVNDLEEMRLYQESRKRALVSQSPEQPIAKIRKKT